MSEFMMSVMPIVVVLVVFLLYIGIGMRIARSKRLSGSIKNWLFPGYVVVLVTAFVLSFFLPLEEGSDATSNRQFDQEKVPKLYRTSEFDVIKNHLADYKVDEWSLETDEQALELASQGLEGIGNVMTERKEDSDGIVEATLYVTPYVIKGIDMTTGLIPKTNMHINGQELIVDKPEPKRLEIGAFQQSFVVKQFKDEQWFDDFDGDLGFTTSEESGETSDEGPWLEMEDDRLFSTQLLYIKIPADMSLESAEDNLNNRIIDGN